MALVKDIRKTVTDTTPVYAAVGVTDLAIERLRDAGNRVVALRLDLGVSSLQDMAVKRFEKVSEQAQQIPAQVRNQTSDVADKARETYSGLAVRGEKLVKRIRDQKSTQDLFAQAGNTVSLGKGAVTTVRNAALDTQRAAKVTLTTGRREAESLSSSVQKEVRSAGRSVNKAASSVQGGVRSAGRSAEKAASSTASSAKGTSTTAKKNAESTKSAAKGVATSASKTATSASAAAKTATPKVGD